MIGHVDQQIESALFRTHGAQGGGDAGVVIDIHGQRLDAQGGERCQCFGAAGGGIDKVPAPVKFLRQGSTDTTRATGDQNATGHGAS